MRFFTVQQIGPTRALTPEGYLLCREVKLGRTGKMVYGPDETPVTTGPNGFVEIDREADEVFDADSIASALGKPLVDDHPEKDVSPLTWRLHARGVILNPHRGEGDDSDFLVGDVLVTDDSAIRAINGGKVELSCGYDAEYIELEPGRGKQTDIVYNHFALVDRGRCGPRCAIGDKRTEIEMRTLDKRRSAWDRVRAAFAAKDAKEFEEAVKDAESEEEEKEAKEKKDKAKDEEGGSAVHIHVPGEDAEMGKRMEALEAGHKELADSMKGVKDSLDKLLADGDGKGKDGKNKDDAAEAANTKLEGSLGLEAPPGTGDKAGKAKDSMYLGESFQETIAIAEVLAPGIRIPTYDRASEPKKTYDAICGLRREALELAYNQPDTRGMIIDVLGGRDMNLKTMDGDAVRPIFRAVGALKKAANNGKVTIARTGDGHGQVVGKIASMADLNRLHEKKYHGAK